MNNINGTNWMGEINSHKELSQLNIPGTHDCGTKLVDKNTEKYQCQSLFIREQINIGVRYFDIRCAAGSDGSTQYIKHDSAFCKNEQGNLLTIDELIDIGKAFLQNHPTESLIYRKRQTIRLMSNQRRFISGVVFCIHPEVLLPKALSNPDRQDLYFPVHCKVLAAP